jgi:hypothetical protein
MKKITLILILLTFSMGYSQDLLLGFEPGESGGVNGDPFGDGPAPVVEAGMGSNTTQVLKIVGNPDGEPWQGINLNLTSLVNLTDTQVMTMDVFSDEPITFLVKVTGGVTGPATVAASVSHPGNSEWETVSFTFDTSLDGQGAPATGIYGGFVIHTYWAPGAVTFFNPTVPTPERTFYVDNIRGPLGAPPVIPEPETAAPTPPNRPAADVKSLFSDVYEPVTVIGYTGGTNTFSTEWCPATTTLVQIAGNNTNRITGLGCEGIDFQAGRFDATGFTNLHIDIWTPTPTQDKSFNIKFSNWSNGDGETNAFEFSATNANLLPSGSEESWISLDIPLSDFNCIGGGCPDLTDFVQFVITSDLGTVYYDNLYLHKNTVLSTNQFTIADFKVFPNPAEDSWNIVNKTSQAFTVNLYDVNGKLISVFENISSQELTIDASSLKAGIYFAKITSDDASTTLKLVKK